MLVTPHRLNRLAKLIDDANLAPDHVYTGVMQQQKLFFESGGMRVVVRVHSRDHRCGRFSGSTVGCRADAQCILLNQAQPWVVHLANDCRAVIDGTVVDDNEFEFAKGGIKNGTRRPLNRRRRIAHRQHYRDV